MSDVVGVGANSVDYVYRLPAFPTPEGPASKLRITHHAVSPGGQTATTLCTCAAMGLEATYIGAAGNDDNGELIRDELVNRGVDVSQLAIRDANNAFAVILLHDTYGERVVLWDRTPELDLEPEEIDPLVIREARLVHVDDVDIDAAIRAALVARDAGIPVTSDIECVGTRTGELLAAVSIPIFAEHVLQELTGERDFERALRKVRMKPDTPRGGGHDMVCVTLGSRGAMLLHGDRLFHQPGMPVDVVDTTGAGDVFRGAFIAALLRGDAPQQILRFATTAAGLSCTRPGAIGGIPTLAEMRALL
jgi:sugar/nucleoside kinase (ribokinase family)